MSEYKLQPNLYSLMDRSRMQTHLERMAAKGWQLAKAGPYVWRYRRAEPKQLRYCVAYFSKGSLYDPEDAPQQRTYRDYWQEAGWEYVACFDCLQIFCTEDPDLAPIETDPQLRLESIHSCVKKRDRFLWIFLAALAVLMIGAAALSYSADPVEVLSDGPLQLSCVIMLVMLLFTGWEAIRYYCWRGKAQKQLAAEGAFTELKGSYVIELVFAAVMLALFILLLVIQSPYERLVTLVDVSSYAVIFAVASLTRFIKRKEQAERRDNIMTTVTAVLLTALALGMVEAALLDNYKPKHTEADMLLTISDLTQEQYTDTYYREEVQRSLFLEDVTEYQFVGNDGADERLLQYRITKIKLPSLTQMCWENCLPAHLQETLTVQEADAWGAESVWLHRADSGRYTYYMYYSDRTVTLMLDWEPTAEQIAIVAEVLKNA